MSEFLAEQIVGLTVYQYIEINQYFRVGILTNNPCCFLLFILIPPVNHIINNKLFLPLDLKKMSAYFSVKQISFAVTIL